MTEREALKLALEALEEINKLSIGENAICLPAEIDTAMDAIKEALAQPEHGWTPERIAGMARLKDAQDKRLAQPEQEPVEWGVDWGRAGETSCVSIIKRTPNGGIEVLAVEYGPQRTWVGLTDEEVNKLVDDEDWYNDPHKFSRIVEAKVREKNYAS